jgi:DNA-binding MarR family transcriptional regulator
MPRRPTSEIATAQSREPLVCTATVLIYTAYVEKALKTALRENTTLNTTQYCVLLVLLRNDGHQRMGRIAKTLSVTSSTISVAAQALETRDLARRVALEDDKRAQELHITDSGEQVVIKADKVVAKTIADIWEPLTSQQRKSLFKSALKAMDENNRTRIDAGLRRADTAYAEGTLISYHAFAHAAKLHGLNYCEAATLAWLEEHDCMVGKGQLAEKLMVKPNYFSQICNGLTKRGLICENRIKDDRRRVLVGLTQAGRERALRTRSDLNAVVATSIYKTSPEEQRVFREIAEIVLRKEQGKTA